MGTVTPVDLNPAATRHKALAPLLDRGSFENARVSPEGFTVEWSDDVDLSAAQLWRWAKTVKLAWATITAGLATIMR